MVANRARGLAAGVPLEDDARFKARAPRTPVPYLAETDVEFVSSKVS